MSVYLVAQIRIDDRDGYDQYQAGFLPIFQKYRGELLAVDDAPRVIEGGSPDDREAGRGGERDWGFTRMVLLRFPDPEAAADWYGSPEYQELMQKRLSASEAFITLVNGID
jgi:uncharacterized protein (DUF1330 family)